jgi:hypothetical protein
MRPWQNKLAILAGFLVAGAIYPWPFRLECAVAAIVIILVLLMIRLRTHAAAVTRRNTDDILSKVERIRASRPQIRPNRRD